MSYSKQYRFQCIHAYEYHDKTFNNLNELLKFAHLIGLYDLTRARLNTIRKRELKGCTFTRYKNIIITDIEKPKKTTTTTATQTENTDEIVGAEA